ncbi:conserved hypothetical protein [Nostocoides japonicum T1-X7]|uniref:Glycosyl hydrolase family 32 N-terminal domain-containing protein n=1 Tax=Nostocoides japonicum T1-X7 TaxID=1194083 RepID=A0A077LTK9_9MICO|nr:hypothetical protein [Tetrasphaera japonica]CCH76918.1 conserved hypothetical protein [Tetrasphaera japonica T1-X7]
MSTTLDLLLPRFDDAEVAVPAPGPGPGNWAGAASAVLVDDVFWLAYRVRRPLDEGRGVSVVVARSTDGVRFTTVCEVSRDAFGAASFERPVVMPTDDGWRLYLSCATPGSKHWWIEALDAARPEDLPSGHRTVVLAGDADWGVKDPVVVRDGDRWRMWVCCHPLAEPGHEDRMVTRYATSPDGLVWHDEGVALAPTPDRWDSRGTRVTTVLGLDPLTVLYDGRATAEANWFETTGLAQAVDGRLVPVSDTPLVASPEGDGAFRYAAAVPLPDGRARFYAEVARADGSHDLMTTVAGRPA